MIVDPCTLEEILPKIKEADFGELETTELYPWEWLDYVDS